MGLGVLESEPDNCPFILPKWEREAAKSILFGHVFLYACMFDFFLGLYIHARAKEPGKETMLALLTCNSDGQNYKTFPSPIFAIYLLFNSVLCLKLTFILF